MNKFFSLMAVVLAAATVFTSCKKDDNNSGFPATLDGCYGTTLDTASISLWISPDRAQFTMYDPNDNYRTILKVDGVFNYDASTGKGYISSNGTDQVDVQASKGVKTGIVNVTLKTLSDTNNFDMTILTPVGFIDGSWYNVLTGSDSIYIYDLNVISLTEGSFICNRVPIFGEDTTEIFNLTLTQIYGFYQVGEYSDKMSAGTMYFTNGTETMSSLVFRNNNEGTLTLYFNEDGYQGEYYLYKE